MISTQGLTPASRFRGIYSIQTLEQDTIRVQPQQLANRVSVEDTYTEQPELVMLSNLFRALRRLAKQGEDAGTFQLVDHPESRVYSPEDVSGPYLYSTETVILTNDAQGNHMTAWQNEVERPSKEAADAQVRSGKMTKAPPGYGARRSSTQSFFNRYLPEAVPVAVRLESERALRITPFDSARPAFDLPV